MKRGHVAMLVLVPVLALGGCGGSDDGGADAGSAPSSPGASAPASAPSGTAPGKGSTAAPTPPAESKVTKQFNDCMEGQGVKLPSPNPSTSLGKRDVEKMKAALKTCMRRLQPTPSSSPG